MLQAAARKFLETQNKGKTKLHHGQQSLKPVSYTHLVGLGGTLDSTNVIEKPACAVITALGMDHVKELGPTLADIAAAKAGIRCV